MIPLRGDTQLGILFFLQTRTKAKHRGILFLRTRTKAKSLIIYVVGGRKHQPRRVIFWGTPARAEHMKFI